MDLGEDSQGPSEEDGLGGKGGPSPQEEGKESLHMTISIAMTAIITIATTILSVGKHAFWEFCRSKGADLVV